jgi:hypothetical protein
MNQRHLGERPSRSMHNCRIEIPARDRRQNCTHVTHN